MNQSSAPLISVVVPTRDRPNALSRCLDALAAQTVDDSLEILVVDDGSSSPRAVATAVARHPRAILIRRAGRGPAAARNVGARAATGAVVCFTDDDCLPEPQWAEQFLAALRRGADAAGGATIAEGGALAEASELIARAPVRADEADGDSVSFAPSNNLACWKSVMEAVPFDESYPGAAGEDREWCARLLSTGHTLRYVPSARVVHRQELTFRRFLRQQIRYGEGAFRFRRGRANKSQLERPSFYVALIRRAFARGFVIGLLVSAAQGATAVGFIRAWTTGRGESASSSPKSGRPPQ